MMVASKPTLFAQHEEKSAMLIIPGQADVTCTQSEVPNPSILLELKWWSVVSIFQSKGMLRPKDVFFREENQ